MRYLLQKFFINYSYNYILQSPLKIFNIKIANISSHISNQHISNKKKISTKFYLYFLRKIVRFFPNDIIISISEGRNKENLSQFIFKGNHIRIIDEKPGISRRKRNTLNIF